ncbi:SPONdin (Extracellular matrix glycoprotein) [Paragonimus heterotremus]|uniref:SPONdin (Extracellular matrix glycoprotein) n=1 Tax=Paragonimus heterotremus TaxID=100268 RepID=A0A8J4X289_9TREM|nr:SPONdin (Extracellular matrix glycoprotein) [Paragonimus heterotremus]
MMWADHDHIKLFCKLAFYLSLLFTQGALGVDDESNVLPRHCTQLKTSIKVYGDYVRDEAEDISNSIPADIRNGTVEDNGFELRVRRASDGVMVSGWYEPGREYVITLTNRYQWVGFRDAILWLEVGRHDSHMKLDAPLMKDSEAGHSWTNKQNSQCQYHPSYLGTWIHHPSGNSATQSRFGCHGLTAERLNQVRSWVTQLVLSWRAPSTFQTPLPGCPANPQLGCITIKSAVRARGGHNSVYAATGGLRKTLCPSVDRPPSPVLPAYMTEPEQPAGTSSKVSKRSSGSMKLSSKDTMHMDNMQPMDCCACGSATYNLTFQGLWTRETHPRDWPVHNPGLLHWTNLIGASHIPGFRIYQFGEPASAGVSAVCAYGDTTVLKQSLGIAASNTGSISSVPTGTQRGAMGIGPLHSLISTPGMWSEETLTESRSTLVGVNRTHPLISFLSMLGPSPNWCAGIASQSVCQADCTWVKQLQIDLFPWDAGVRNGETYIPKEADRKDIPDPIRYITADWMPNHPFTPNLPVARVTLERVLPREQWQCTSKLGDGVELFDSDGSTTVVGGRTVATDSERSQPVNSVVGDVTGGMIKKSRSHKSGSPSSGGLAGDSPLSDPSLAQMATFLCITDSWSQWSQCSVTCGVGRRERRRVMLVNKKNELCQHVPLVEEEPCEGRKRTCDFSLPCSLLPWTEWTPCNATCLDRNGQQTRRRYLVRPEERKQCEHLFVTTKEKQSNTVIEQRHCGPTDTECDPVTICGEGRKDGIACGNKVQAFYYSAVDHSCMPFEYLGCKGGRNRFVTKQACEEMCLGVVESLPAWRRERMALLQYQTSQIASDDNDRRKMMHMKPAEHCGELMDPGEPCEYSKDQRMVAWYFSPRTRRCFEFVYLGCGGNKNRYADYKSCISDCLPQEWEKAKQMAKAFAATSKRSKYKADLDTPAADSEVDDGTPTDLQRINSLWGPKQDCQLTPWGGWSPCSVTRSYQIGTRMRWRHIVKPARHGGQPCGILFEQEHCNGFI